MLSRIENKIMGYLFTRCRGKRTVLIAPQEILDNIAPKYEITKKQLEVHMKNLVLDGYVDFSNASRAEGGDKTNDSYVITLTTRGEAFQRERDDHDGHPACSRTPRSPGAHRSQPAHVLVTLLVNDGPGRASAAARAAFAWTRSRSRTVVILGLPHNRIVEISRIYYMTGGIYARQ